MFAIKWVAVEEKSESSGEVATAPGAELENSSEQKGQITQHYYGAPRTEGDMPARLDWERDAEGSPRIELFYAESERDAEPYQTGGYERVEVENAPDEVSAEALWFVRLKT